MLVTKQCSWVFSRLEILARNLVWLPLLWAGCSNTFILYVVFTKFYCHIVTLRIRDDHIHAYGLMVTVLSYRFWLSQFGLDFTFWGLSTRDSIRTWNFLHESFGLVNKNRYKYSFTHVCIWSTCCLFSYPWLLETAGQE